ncbi:hypothetical protein JR316_0009315 [Psilocybe cubensis]|uniref:Uncharacterized protein n=1 Tax=Psilocybe cubensis TaxID=181762 RepID=A0ACB8GT88_PSICU|nr:hypothetical protein JR316_0009315 [Psilocybe cubensis]KAH9478853.1 hypothetical protein JR316_0009315 [Psilocybe cubensis]
MDTKLEGYPVDEDPSIIIKAPRKLLMLPARDMVAETSLKFCYNFRKGGFRSLHSVGSHHSRSRDKMAHSSGSQFYFEDRDIPESAYPA